MLHTPNTITFDPSNKDHRAAVRKFLERNAWSDSPIRFSEDPKFGSVATQVQTKLLHWFLEQDVAKELKAMATKKAKSSKSQENVRQLKKA